MTARIIDGKAIAAALRAAVAAEVQRLTRAHGLEPGLAVVLVGENPASAVYVRSKAKQTVEAGMHSFDHRLPETISENEVLALVAKLNADPAVHGILVQLPLPKQIDSQKVLAAIDPAKDVDGFHPVNVGRLTINEPGLRPCTPSGIIELLVRNNIKIEGSRAIVIGRSRIVGLPVALMLLHKNATVTIAHSRTEDLPAVAREADILIAAIGKTAVVGGNFIKPGAAVVDVGTNRVTNREDLVRFYGDDPKRHAAFEKNGYTSIGDVNPREVREVAGYLTPVPGGVGPLTIAMLMKNTLTAMKMRRA
jgi:methylenetetrahydrofolate dehydrogenase (NADP+)/methenyltetrahydrofolate cyclohydrolase